MNFLLNLSSRTDLSPRGFVAILNFVHDMIALEQKSFMQKIFKVRTSNNVLELFEIALFINEGQLTT
jgi:hypothetical protein